MLKVKRAGISVDTLVINVGLVSISSTFYVRIFRTNVIFLVTFWLCQKIRMKNLYVKRWWNWALRLILPTYVCGFLDEKHLVANSIWWMTHSIDKWRAIDIYRRNIRYGRANLTNFSTFIWQKSAVSELVKLNGDFFAKHCAPATFWLVHKVWWNWPLQRGH